MEAKKLNEPMNVREMILQKSYNRDLHLGTVSQSAFKLLESSSYRKLMKQSTFDVLSRSIEESSMQLAYYKTNRGFFAANLSEGLKVFSAAINIGTPASSMALKTARSLASKYAHMGNVVNTINLEKLYNITNQVLLDEEKQDIDDAAKSIANKYNEEIKPEGNEDATQRKKLDAEQIRAWLALILTFFELLFYTSSMDISINNSFNTYSEVNNYYVNVKELDADSLNMANFRIVNQDCLPRLKHDCHSAVAGKLSEGQVVRVISKDKKWIQIEWEDEVGESCFGWIQNYKVNEFKKIKVN